ncbi:hypothetical protein E1B28_010987 [Marasmius oreades]|uniref:NADAR domain-containing protein n=1 Tax=Marasmius oreades TaxID=181124 RepID=A0A9P7RT53_9AGAR|nr:uncharacterized protein E1B28_010987 [Marasmius oreades]KAG7089289.1 hypothetical protein E1B28_010987 [Marasmius oreades]
MLRAISSLTGRPLPSPDTTSCKVCGNKPFVENGYRHPFCSRNCARIAFGKRTVHGHQDLCEACGNRPKFVENGYQHPYCSRTCSRRAKHQNIPLHVAKASPFAGRSTIHFYHKRDPYYGFTNFSPHPVNYNGELYPTSEHLFQSFKFEHNPDLVKHIRTFSPWPRDVFAEARRLQHEVRHDWNQVKIEKMELALYLKFTQHPDIRVELLSTGNAELVEDSDKDSFWGIGSDRLGRNELGKALERLRSLLHARGY